MVLLLRSRDFCMRDYFKQASSMQVILLKDVIHVGQKGDLKNVSDGYARNYLFPRKLATIADDPTIKNIERIKLQKADHQGRTAERYKADAERIKTISLPFRMKASEKGTTFSSIHTKEIVDALARHKITIKSEWIELDEAIKTIGEYVVPIHFPNSMTSAVRIIIEPQ